jgi:RNA polymerase sigma-70 factor (ECF subfamily)
MLRLGFPGVSRFVETDDVLQNALIRLDRALSGASLESFLHFGSLAACVIRRELIDLARHYFGPRGAGANLRRDTRAVEEEPDRESQPDTLEDWTFFHEVAEQLPGPQREVFWLLWYGGLSQEEAAARLKASVRTVERRWARARVLLSRALHGQPPERMEERRG